jgi:DNA-binding response OmpR family regulator
MPRILIVDDIAIREALGEALADLGHTAAAVADGDAALDWLARHGADAVLLDLRMPGLDGMERRIRCRADPPPVAVLTAVPTSTNRIEAMRLGAVDHIAKPVGRDELRSLVTRLLAARGEARAGLPEDQYRCVVVGEQADRLPHFPPSGAGANEFVVGQLRGRGARAPRSRTGPSRAFAIASLIRWRPQTQSGRCTRAGAVR